MGPQGAFNRAPQEDKYGRNFHYEMNCYKKSEYKKSCFKMGRFMIL